MGKIGLLILEEQRKTACVVLDERVVVNCAVAITVAVCEWAIKETIAFGIKRNIQQRLHLAAGDSLVLLMKMNIPDPDIKHFVEADRGRLDDVGIAVARVSNWVVSRHARRRRCKRIR